MDTWTECAWFNCRKRFEPSRRSNQFHHAGGIHHAGALYCSPGCKQKAYRFRRDTADATVTKTPERTTTQATVTRPAQHIEYIGGFSAKNDHPRLTFQLPAGYVYPDWQSCLPSDWQSLPDLPIPAFLRRSS
jgi:hypothetical protein